MKLLVLINQYLWNGPVLILLLCIHVYYTIHLHVVQRKILTGISLSLRDDDTTSATGFGRFGSLTTTLAATLGTGNIVGMSVAVYMGGPGAVFWCWITGVLGMATTYAETALCHRLRHEDANHVSYGGPMYILHYHMHRPLLAKVYSIALCLSAFCIGCTTQSNAITDCCHRTYGIPPAIVAIVTAFLVGLILMQGRRWIERFSSTLVPAMAIFFFSGCVLYLILHAGYIVPAIRQIISQAWGLATIGSGAVGYGIGKAVRHGVARGLFTNESGLGTAGLIAGGSAEPSTEDQALISMSATFWDTVVLCGITGLVLVAYQLQYPSEWVTGTASSLTTYAFDKLPLWGDEILAMAVTCFALATLVGWSYIGKQGYDYLSGGRGTCIYQALYILMIFIGGMLPLDLVWETTDLINLSLLIPNAWILLKCRHEV